MKKIYFTGKKFIMSLFMVVFAVIALIIAAAFITNYSSDDDSMNVNLYFLNPVTNEISSEVRTINSGKDTEILERVLQELTAGPKNSNLKRTLPENLKILKCTLVKSDDEGDTAEVDFSKEYHNLTESQELFCRASVVWTLTDLDFISNVNILVEGTPLTRANGQVVGNLNKGNVVVNPVISPEKTDIRKIKIYFADEQAMGLISEVRNIEAKQSQTLENQIVEQLILGPRRDDLYPTIPSETKINDIRTEEGICYVNLSNDFVAKHSGGSSSEVLTIYSIVNSLTEINSVKKVQFLIDGEKISDFKGHLDFSKPFERNEALILDE